MNFKLNYKFKNKNLLKQAFIHRSYLNENKGENLESNERLEFLGDAVLELIVSLYFFEKYPSYPEGDLTTIRSKLVQTKTLSLVAKKLDFGKNLKLSKGERVSGGSKNESILADTFEAVVGAIYKDGGFDSAFQFVKKNLLEPAEKVFSDKLPKDYKSRLQEIIQAQDKPTPAYKVIASSGPDHNKIFKVAVLVNNKKLAVGAGRSKQEAEQQAAKKGLCAQTQPDYHCLDSTRKEIKNVKN